MQLAFEDAGFSLPASHEWPAHEVPAGHPPPQSIPDERLTPARIASGIAALRTDSLLLLMDPHVRSPADRDRLGILTFLCLHAADAGEETLWVPLTARPGTHRLSVEERWRLGGNYRWRNGDLYLLDTQRLWAGPRASFAHAAWREAFNGFSERAHLTAEGLAEVRSCIEVVGGGCAGSVELPW